MNTTINATEINPSYCRWSAREDEILVNALTDENIHTVADVCRLVSEVTGRTERSVSARIYGCYREMLVENNFKTNIITQEIAEDVSEQIHFDLLEAKEEVEKDTLDSRTIFDLYEKLSMFKQLVDDLRGENTQLKEANASLRQYHDLSEIEITRLRNELSNTNQERNKTIEHIKSIQNMITSLSSSAFGKEPNKQEVAV